MSDKSFVDLVKKHASESAAVQIDWTARKNAWIEALRDLFDEIRGWLQLLIVDGTVQIQNEEVHLTEQFIGSYQAPVMKIWVGGLPKASVRPKGTLIVGGLGRVDVEGPRGVSTLILLTKDQSLLSHEQIKQAKWYVVGKDKKPLPLDESAFQQVFLSTSGIR